MNTAVDRHPYNHSTYGSQTRSVLYSVRPIRSCKARVRVPAADGRDRVQPVKCVSRLRPSEMKGDDRSRVPRSHVRVRLHYSAGLCGEEAGETSETTEHERLHPDELPS